MKFNVFILIFLPVIASTWEKCGQRTSPQRSPRFVLYVNDGTESTSYSWPWMASMRICIDKCDVICGGTLIDSRHILTAAHCVFKSERDKKVVIMKYGMDYFKHHIGKRLDERSVYKPQYIQILLGMDQESNVENDPNAKIAAVEYIDIHPKWDSENNLNDIAVIRLAEEVTFTEKISPVCLPEKEMSPFEDMSCYATGRGMTEKGSYPNKLREVKVNVEEINGNPTELKIYGVENPGSGICFGDSGGPLVCSDPKKGIWYQYGVTAHILQNSDDKTDVDMCTNGNPDHFMKVTAYLDWIVNTVKKLEKNDPCSRATCPEDTICVLTTSAENFKCVQNRKH